MKRKILVCFLVALSMFSLCACGKEKEETTEEIDHNYAINETRDTTEEEFEDTEESTYQPTTEYSTTETSNPNKLVKDDNTYNYPTDDSEDYLVNTCKIGTLIPYGFMYNDIIAEPNIGIDKIKQISKENKIYAQGYLYNLVLSNSSSDSSHVQIAIIKDAIDTIQIGNTEYKSTDLFYNAENIEDLIKNLSDNFTIICDTNYNKDDIFSYATNLGKNNMYGNTYEWKFSLDDKISNYSEFELSQLESESDKMLSSYIKVVAEYDVYENINNYKLYTNIATRYWVTEEMTQDYTRETEIIDNEDGTFDVIYGDTHYSDPVPTGNYEITPNGHNIDIFMKMKDGSIVALDNFELLMYNPNTATNKNITVNYMNE